MTTLSVPSSASTLSGRPIGLTERLLVGLAATILVAVAAHVAFPLPFTPVPFTLQPLAVLVVGMALGPLDGAFVMLAYLAEGAAGLPVFSPTGTGGGVLHLLGPTGGYLMSYPLVAAVCGGVSRSLAPRWGIFAGSVAGGLLAVGLLFLSGAAWLAHLLPLHGRGLWLAAVGPFLPGEVAKVFIAAGICRALPIYRPRP